VAALIEKAAPAQVHTVVFGASDKRASFETG